MGLFVTCVVTGGAIDIETPGFIPGVIPDVTGNPDVAGVPIIIAVVDTVDVDDTVVSFESVFTDGIKDEGCCDVTAALAAA